MKTKKKALASKMSYEPEADLLRVELAFGKIDYAQEMGPFIVHYSKKNEPLYIEILEARKFFSQSQKILEARVSEQVRIRK